MRQAVLPVACAAACCLLLLGCAVVRIPLAPSPEVEEVTLAGEGPAKILLLDVSDEISFREPLTLPGWPQRESLPAVVRADLDRARRDPAVRAVLLRIDSPGGTVTASDVVFHEIRLFREERGLPVVAAVLEKALSGGYYVALAADEIVAHPTALVGSVGVFVPKIDASGLLERWGIRSEVTTSGPQKDLLSPLRPLSAEGTATLQGIVDEFQQRFLETVRTARSEVTEEGLAEIASAAPFTARRALELHMIDRVGYLQDAYQSALAQAGLGRARLVAYRRPSASPRPGPYSLVELLALLDSGPLYLDPRWLQGALGSAPQYAAP